MAGRPFRPDYLTYLPGPQAAYDRWSHHKREQEGSDRRTRGAKADVVEEIENDVSLAQRREPVIEHQTSAGMKRSTGGVDVLRAGLERRKYTLQGHATGCLQHHDLVSPEMLSESRAQLQWVAGGDETVPQRPGVGFESRHKLPHGGEQLGVQLNQLVCYLPMQPGGFGAELTHGPGNKHQAPLAPHGPGSGDHSPERLRVGVVAIVQDGELSFLQQLAPAARHRELLQSLGCLLQVEAQLLSHRPDPYSVVRLMEPPRAEHEPLAADRDHRTSVAVQAD